MANGTAVASSVPESPLPEDDLPLETGANADTEVEVRARDMGWKPLAEYRGPPGKWQPAADFISRGENILPIVRDQNRRLTERVGKLEGEISGLRTTAEEQLQIIKEQRELGRKADQRGYDRAMEEIKAKQRLAVEQGDTRAYDQLVEQAEALASARPDAPAVLVQEPPKPAPQPRAPQLSPAVAAFVSANPWFNADPFLSRKMIDAHLDVIHEGEIADEGAQLTEARQRLVDTYPDKFGTAAPPTPRPPARRRVAAVVAPTPGGELPDNRPGARTINSIPDATERGQAREAFNRMKRQITDYTEAEYMALYDDPRADVLTTQKPRKVTA